MQQKPHVVIIGGGFGGLYTAKALAKTDAQITLIDRRNFHLFQPLLYQVAMAGLSPGNIAAPLRGILGQHENVTVLMGEVTDIDPVQQEVILRGEDRDDDTIAYDALIVATGASHSYFGNDQWANDAPGLKTLEEALDIRRRILSAYEAAERETDPDKRAALLTFVVVGAGPTGVELAGALGEMALYTLKGEFRNINPAEAKVLLIEGSDRVLPPYTPDLSARAQRQLERLGVTVQTNSLVTNIGEESVTVKQADTTKQGDMTQQGDIAQTIPCRTVLWAAGVQASALGKVLHQTTGAELDRAGRVKVEPDLSIADYPSIFVIGDLAHFSHNIERPLPGVAPVAMQQGRYVAKLLTDRLTGEQTKTQPQPFRYTDKGSMATIGRAAAVAQIGQLRFAGLLAWLAWLFVHLLFLAEFSNRLLVFVQWGWNYFTYKRGVRLIVGQAEEVSNIDDPV